MSTPPDSSQLTHFERQVLDLILDGTSPEARTLQEQVAVALVSERTHTGRGFCVWFEIPEFGPRLSGRPGADIANMAGHVEGRDGTWCDAYFILHIRDEQITMLECIGSGPTWPEHPQLTNHHYTKRGRDGPILS